MTLSKRIYGTVPVMDPARLAMVQEYLEDREKIIKEIEDIAAKFQMKEA